MAFWGVEVKSGSPFTLKANESTGIRLHLSQATLGHGNGPERSILQCNVGNKSPILLCALSPDKVDSHQLNLEFDEADEVIFSVLGPRSLHLSGYFIDRSTRYFVDKTSEPNDDDKTESYGEDIGYSDMERASSTDDYDYSDSFINDEDSDVPSIDDDEISIKEMENGKGGRLRKKFEVSNSDSAEILASADASSDENYVEVLNNGEYKIPKVRFSKRPIRREDLMRSWKARRSTLEKGEPSAKIENTSEARTHTHKTLDKREDKPLGDDVNLSPVQKGGDVLSKENEKWKNMIECLKNENPTTKKWWNEYSTDVLPSQNGDATLSNKKRTRDMIEETSDVQKNQLECSETKKQAIDKNFEKEAATQKPLESETSSNGVMTEEIEKEKLDGESAVKGKKVSILYTEKLEDTGKLFDSNLGEAPLTCRLGGEEVTEGLSIGVEDVINTNTNTEERLREDVPKNEVEAVKIR